MSQELLLTVQSAATLNEFLREELPKVLDADCSQGQNLRRDLEGLQAQDCGQKSLQAKDCGAAGQNSLQDQNVGAAAKSAVSNSKIRRLIFSQNVFVSQESSQAQNARNQKASQAKDARGGFAPCKNPSLLLKKNARVKVFLDKEKFFYQKENDDIKFELDSSRVLYEDDAIIVVNKPPRFPSEATFVHDRDNLQAAVVRYLHKKIGLDKNPPYCGMVHRLDRDTSGVILFSKQRAANAALFAAFDSNDAESVGKTGKAAAPLGRASNSAGGETAERAAQKIYVAICAPAGSYGLSKDSETASARKPKKAAANPRLAKDSFSVQNYLGRVSPKSQAAKWGFVPKEKGGKFARTDFKILEKKGGLAFVQVKLWTGRTHQIRVHLAQSGLAILGDELYGGRPAERIFLHALTLDLPHPISGAPLHFEAPLPPEFSAAF